MDFFSLCYGFFPVCHGLHRAVVWVIHGVTCRLPVYRRIFFPCVLWIFSCHSLLGICVSLQYVQSSWCAMCCELYSCWGWMDFSCLIWIFFLCAILCIPTVVWVIGGVTCRLPVYGRISPVCFGFFSVIHSWSFMHQCSMFRVVAVQCAVSLYSCILMHSMNGFLANVNSCSCSLYVVVRPSVVCLSST